MELARLREEKRQLVERFGEWTDHNIRLADGLYTIAPKASLEKLRRIVQVICKPLHKLRIVLDFIVTRVSSIACSSTAR